MSSYTIFLFILAIIAGVVGFSGITVSALGMVEFLFFVALTFLVINEVVALIRGRPLV